MIGVHKYLAVILLLIVGIVDSQLPQYGASSGGDSGLGTVGSLPVNIGIGSGASRQGSGGFRGSSSSGSIGSNIGGGEGQGGARSGGEDHQGLDWLREALPGEPEIDYPIYSLPPPSSSFSCNGRVEGGYYADTELRCQAFQICVHDSEGGLVKYSFLCPNGSLFDQQYFVCDFWFNVDCAQAESFYFLNDEIDEERESNIGSVAPEGGVVLGDGQDGRNLFNGRGSTTGPVGDSSSNNRRPGSGNRGSSSNNIGEGNIQTLYGAPRPGRDVLVMEDKNLNEYTFEDNIDSEIENIIGLQEPTYQK